MGSESYIREAPITAFALAIIGLLLCVAGVSFAPGGACCIAALVLNAAYDRRALYNPKKTATAVMASIGCVLCAIACALLIAALSIQASISDDSRGKVSFGDVDVTIEAPQHAEDEGVAYADEHAENVRLSMLLEKDGAGIVSALEDAGYAYRDNLKSWTGELSGAQFFTAYDGNNKEMDPSALGKLGYGASGTAASFAYLADGASPADAFSEVSDVAVIDVKEEGSELSAIVANSEGERYLVSVSTSSDVSFIEVVNELYIVNRWSLPDVETAFEWR